MGLCLSVSQSQVGILSKWMDVSSWFFGMQASFDLSYSVLQGNSDICRNKDSGQWNFVLNSTFENFASAYRSSNMYPLSSRKVDAQSVIN